jgi:hypothetical protein
MLPSMASHGGGAVDVDSSPDSQRPRAIAVRAVGAVKVYTPTVDGILGVMRSLGS